ncbi:hypothetical protein FVW20_17865 [Desulfovibrio oxamicus]|uniref:Uncharacterized protein n=1 Tax=Nitratidesulfovibrio oxamicus TaxID=32016 RepID=A0ABS0J8M2_9BACT|nr:hypothetical protein [Nitratidesulfovibrio oxamicus]MBG3878815.1 hypothetical protein [Nitratidesulfovibrio oxamicus]
MKKQNADLGGYRLKLSAFFNNEYALRHIVTNPKYEEHLSLLPALKTDLQNTLGELYTEHSADAFVEYYTFMDKDNEDMDIYNQALLRRVMDHAHGDDFDKHWKFMDVYNEYISNKANEALISGLSKISLEHGVYATHADTFRNKEYSMLAISEKNITASIEPIFPKKEFFLNINWMPLWASIEETYNTPLADKSKALQHLCFFIDFEELDQHYDDVLNRIKSTLSMIAYEQNPQKHTNDDTITRHYFNTFFNTTKLKDVEAEISNRLFSLVLWDNINFKKMNKTEAFIETQKTIRSRRKTAICEKDSCLNLSKKCDYFSECYNLAQHTYDATDKSIKKGRLATSKE